MHKYNVHLNTNGSCSLLIVTTNLILYIYSYLLSRGNRMVEFVVGKITLFTNLIIKHNDQYITDNVHFKIYYGGIAIST